MANRKLTYEVDLDTQKARQKAQQLSESVSGGSSWGATASPVALSGGVASRASRSIENLGDAAEKSAINMKSAVRAFAGIGVGMAMNYAAGHLEDGSTAQRAVKYGASAVQGAAMGAMVGGPWGAVAGGALGLAKQYIDQSGEDKAKAEEEQKAVKERRDAVKSQSEAIQKTREWKELTDRLTNTETDLIARQKELQDEIAKREKREEELRGALSGEAGPGGDPKNFQKLMTERAQNAGQIDALKALAKDLSRGAGASSHQSRGAGASSPALDALSRVGGAFAGQKNPTQKLENLSEKMVQELEKIERKFGSSKGTF